jgi:hypothetical protein
MSSHLSVFCAGLSLIVEADHLRDGAQVNIIANVTEQGGRDSPKNSVLALGNILLSLFHSSLSSFCVDDLMITGENIAASHVLKHSTSLEEEASRWDLDSDLLHVAKPHKEAWVARLAVDGQEIEVVMEASKSCANVILLKV